MTYYLVSLCTWKKSCCLLIRFIAGHEVCPEVTPRLRGGVSTVCRHTNPGVMLTSHRCVKAEVPWLDCRDEWSVGGLAPHWFLCWRDYCTSGLHIQSWDILKTSTAPPVIVIRRWAAPGCEQMYYQNMHFQSFDLKVKVIQRAVEILRVKPLFGFKDDVWWQIRLTFLFVCFFYFFLTFWEKCSLTATSSSRGYV